MIYFISTSDNRYIKIGKASDPVKRLSSIQTGHPEKLKLVAFIPGDLSLEKRLHEKFGKLRSHLEWFHNDPSILSLALSTKATILYPRKSKRYSKDSFMPLARLQPQLIELYMKMASFMDERNETKCCANELWYFYGKPRLLPLVGWESRGQHPTLRTMEAYDIAYQTCYDALPDCRNCGCY